MASGKILTLLVIATLLALIGAWIVARTYRKRMQGLMQAPLAASAPGDVVVTGRPPARPAPPTNWRLEDNQKAHHRLLWTFAALTLPISLTRTVLTQIMADGPLSITIIAALGTAYAWPILPVLAVIGRWSRPRFILAMLIWCAFAIVLLSWRTNENVSVSMVTTWVLFDTAMPLFVVTAICLGGATRAISPWLAPLLAVFIGSSILGLDFLQTLFDTQSPLVGWLVQWFSPVSAMTLFAILPWLIVWWPVRALGRWLGQAYRERRISELFYLYTAVWAIAVAGPTLGDIDGSGWKSLINLLPLLWIPLGAWLMKRHVIPSMSNSPPTLLVLRVFKQDANVQAIFDRVIERWRLSGNTVLIAGTDLAYRTIDADDVFTFLDGRLGERFVARPSDIDARIAQMEFQPDTEGRYRINECYCHDTTWQQALDRLVGISDVVLMDLRNFKAKNAGCVHELGVLSKAPNLARVVILTNPDTEREAAQAAAAGAPDGRFVWLDESSRNSLKPADVLAALFPTATAATR
ncbi:MAG: hypothetical protein H6R14_2281 [Proteobacteria bacterium]|nr:hypothetical protein [Pseudomonadota bacterium]